MTRPHPASRPVLPLVLRSFVALLLLFLLDALLFRTRFYASNLEPESSTGHLEIILWNELHRKPSGDPEILALGDSRMLLSPRVANELTPSTGYTFARAAVAGTTPRCWYYLLRDLDPTARRYYAIILPVESYDDHDTFEDYPNRILDLRLIIARLRLTDALDFSGSFETASARWRALRGSLFKGFVYQQDFHDFLAHPRERLKKATYFRQESAGWFYGYAGENRTLKGLAIDFAQKRITLPEGTPAAVRQRLEEELLRGPAPQTGRYAAYSRRWFGRIVDRYRNSNTRLVFIRLPRGPVPQPDYGSPPAGSAIRKLASRRNVILCDEHVFDDLERPEFFSDVFHLDTDGAIRFSRMLAQLMHATLGRPSRGEL